MDNEKPTLRRLDTLEEGTLFKWDEKFFISSDTVRAEYGGLWLICWDRSRNIPTVVALGAMVEVVDTQGVFDVAFGRIDTVVGNLQRVAEDTKELIVTERILACVIRLKSHLADLRNYLRDKKPTVVLWSNTTPFDTEAPCVRTDKENVVQNLPNAE